MARSSAGSITASRIRESSYASRHWNTLESVRRTAGIRASRSTSSINAASRCERTSIAISAAVTSSSPSRYRPISVPISVAMSSAIHVRTSSTSASLSSDVVSISTSGGGVAPSALRRGEARATLPSAVAGVNSTPGCTKHPRSIPNTSLTAATSLGAERKLVSRE